MILTYSLILIGGLGGALVYLGLRGRRIDDHPICRKCGFDLTGRNTESDRCSECGADLSPAHAIDYGHRVRRRGLLITGITLCLLASLIASASFIPAVRNFDPTPYKPNSWLTQNLDSSNTSVRRAALRELRRRFDQQQLSEATIKDITVSILKTQADNTKQWDTRLGQFFEELRRAKRVSNGDWENYLRRGLKVKLIARPGARQGDPMPFQIVPESDRLGGCPIEGRYKFQQFSVGNHSALLPSQSLLIFQISANGRNMTNPWIGLDEKMTARLEPGTYHAVGKLEMELWDVLDETMTFRFDLAPAATNEQTTFVDFEILPTNEDIRFAVVDDSFRPRLANALDGTRIIEAEGNTLDVFLEIAPSPARLVGRAFIVVHGRRKKLPLSIDVKSGRHVVLATGIYADGIDADIVDVVFVPDPEKVRRSLDPTPTWGEEIILKNVPIQRKESTK